jgi:PAS domain S-box-containing protein
VSHDSRDEGLNRLHAAVESAPCGLLMTAADGTIVLVNREVERLFGYAREELLGRPVETIVPDAQRKRHRRHHDAFVAGPEARAMGAGREVFGQHRDGSRIPLEIGLTPVTTGEGLFVLAAIVDVSVRKQAEAERHQLEAQLRHAQRLEALGVLAGGIAHDFNNVLGAIVGYAELLRERAGDPQSREDLDAVLRAAGRGRDLVDRILRFTRREKVERRRLDLVSPVAEAAELVRSTLPATVELAVDAAEDTPTVVADATAVHQVLLNLATNSLHAIAAGDPERPGPRGRIAISLYGAYARDSFVRCHPELREGWYAVMDVSDDGCGMPPEVLARACEPFYTTRTDAGGSGLGLAMVRSLLREHGGTVVLESEEAAGTRVRCFFPAEDPGPERASVARPVSAASRGRGERVAYVDDEQALAEVGVRRLRGLGYEATPFTDARAALEAISADPSRFDILVSDFSMPGLDGLELAASVRERSPELPVVIMTCLLYTSPSPRDRQKSRMPSSA